MRITDDYVVIIFSAMQIFKIDFPVEWTVKMLNRKIAVYDIYTRVHHLCGY